MRTLFVTLHLLLAIAIYRAAHVQARRSPACACPIEIAPAGEVSCLSATACARAGLHAGDRVRKDGATPVAIGRMNGAALLAFHLPLPLNDATVAELAALPRVGTALAQRIAARAPYRTVDELREVSGIGDKSFARLSPHLCIERPFLVPSDSRDDDPAEE